MKSFAFVFAFVVGLALSAAPVHAGPRPTSELGLFQILNGERVRALLSDGGPASLLTDSGVPASVTVTGGQVYYIENAGTAACHICTPGPELTTWDGGCSTTISDPNYGSPLAVGGFRWIVTQSTTTVIKALPPAAGGTCVAPVSIMR